MIRKNILISCAGRRVELVKYFQASISKINKNSQVYASDQDPSLSPACHIADKRFKTDFVTEHNYIDSLLEECKKNDIGIIIPTIDTELLSLAENREIFLNNGIQIIISSPKLIEKCRDKRITYELFETLGIENPKIYQSSNIEFPCFCKPYDGSNSSGTSIIKSINDKMRRLHYTLNYLYL